MRDSQTDLICLTDIYQLFLKLRKKLFIISLFFSFLIILVLLFSPLEYEIKASFNEGSFKEQPSSFKDFLDINISSIKGNGVAGVMLSRRVLKPVIENLGLQVQKKEKPVFQNFSKNIFGGKDREEFLFEKVLYTKEKPEIFKMRFLSKDKFVVFKKNKFFEGELKKPLFMGKSSFTLTEAPKDLQLNKTYVFTLSPLEEVAHLLEKKIKILPKKENKNILTLSLNWNNRFLGSDILNGLMNEYQNYLKEENDLFAKEEFSYLQKKQEELSSKLSKSLDEYASYLCQNISQKGFMTLDWEMNSLLTPHNEYQSKLFEIDLELKRLKNTSDEIPSFVDESYSAKKLQKISGDVSSLKSEKDILSLALFRKKEENPSSRLMDQDQKIKKIDLEIQNLKKIGTGDFLSSPAGEPLRDLELKKKELVLQKDEILVKEDPTWAQQRNLNLENLKKEKENLVKFVQEINSKNFDSSKLDNAAFTPLIKNWGDSFNEKEKKEDLLHYLNEHLHLLDVKENMLKDTFFSLDSEFEGLDLESAKGLYENYNLQRDKTKLSINELLHLKEKLSNSSFELSSLGLVLTDPISLDIISKAGQLSLDIEDQKNRSDKDISRLKEELEVQKRFLTFHLQEMIELKNINLSLIEEKLTSLKKVILFNLNQKISLLNTEAKDFVILRTKNLEEEKKLLLEKTKDLRENMVDLPFRWKVEKLLKIRTEMSLNIMKATSDLLESKTIQHHLEQIQSKPLDKAIPPTSAKKPKILFFFLLSFFVFYFLIFVFYFIKNAIRGFPVSLDALRAIGQHVCGVISKNINEKGLRFSDLETLRNISSFLDFPKNITALIGNGGPDYSSALADLISKKGKKTLLIHCDFTKEQTGFLQFFDRKIKNLPIEEEEGYDLLLSGGCSDFSTEILSSKDFTIMLNDLSSKYDDIILYTPSRLFLSEAKSFLKFVNKIIVTIKDETMEELKPYFIWNNKNDCRYLTFILYQKF